MTTVTQDFEYDLKDTAPASSLGGARVIPAGMYEARAVDVELGTSKAGNTQVKLKWQITEGEFAGHKVWDQITFSPKSGPFILAYMVAAGVSRPTERVKASALAGYLAREIAGRVLQIAVGVRTYPDSVTGEEKQANEIVNVAPASVQYGNTAGLDEVENEEDNVPF